jgi:hypothetical protein
MTLRNLVYLTGIAALVFVLGDLFAARTLGAMLSSQELNSFAVANIQVRGAVGLLYVFLAYFSRHADETMLKKVVGPTMMLGFVAQSAAILYALVTPGGYGPSGWIFILLGILFISAYAYFLFVKK